MRKTLSAFPVVLSALCVICLFSLPAHGQGKDEDRGRDNEKGETAAPLNGIVQDWSRRHVVYPRFGPLQSLIAVQNDPRAILSWQEQSRKDWRRVIGRRHPHSPTSTMHRDWSISLGGGTVAPGMFPAKFGLDPTAAPTCADYVVFPVNFAGSATQPNIVAFDNLYSGGTSGSPTGLCGSRTVVAGDDRSSATTLWSYNVTAAGGQVPTSPSISPDGTKVAFVESKVGTTAHFHVLAYKNGDGVDLTTPNAQNVLKPVQLTSGFATLAPAAGSGTVTDLALVPSSGTASDTLSSPFVEYNNDVAYVGNDSGTLFRIKNVFCTIGCTVGVTAAPSLDLSWPTGVDTGMLSVCTGALTGPVSGPGGNIYVGCSDGKVYEVAPSGTILGSVIVGNGLTDGGVVDPPMVDVVNGFIYAVAGNSTGGTSVLVQTNTNFTSTVTTPLGKGGLFNLHSPVFNEDYFSCTPQVVGTCTWMIYALALDAPGTHSALWGVGFNGTHAMNAAPLPVDAFGIGPFEFSPPTTFFDGAKDRLFESALGAFVGNLVAFDVSTGTTFPPVLGPNTTEGSGTSGIIVDNNATGTVQADSIYFGALTANTAVKLTQTGLL